jgi:hypothetical protein
VESIRHIPALSSRFWRHYLRSLLTIVVMGTWISLALLPLLGLLAWAMNVG